MAWAVAPACAGTVDFAQADSVELWLRHPVYGDPSFDAFQRVPGNPIARGAPPYEWPVNGFLFHDPRGGNDYAFVGDYCRGYLQRPSRCVLYRSADAMRSWTNLGVVLQGDVALFDQGGHTPDVSVVFDAGRYHMVYDWGVADFNLEGGLAYAWADKPEGPWHRAPRPITRNSTLPRLLGEYQHTYAPTLVRRRNDWLLVAMTDAAPNRWALFVMTAPRPEGPWSERRLVRHVESDDFQPPLMEFYPAFTHDGFLYAPATSVALNRNFNILCRVPLEQAEDPTAWQIQRCGSLWHSEDVANESKGLWGQTFSGRVDAEGILWALFHSRDASGLGTVNLARRPWNQPLRPSGFVLTGHEGPSLTCLRRTFREFKLEANLHLRGTALIFWDYHGCLGPNSPRSDATLHRLAYTDFEGLEMSPSGWRVIRVDQQGRTVVLASGSHANAPNRTIRLERQSGGRLLVAAAGHELWIGQESAASLTNSYPGAMGIWVGAHTHLSVERFQVSGEPLPAKLRYLSLEALLGAGETAARWTERHGPQFHCGLGLESQQPLARVKWNVTGTRLVLWSPRGPDFGQAETRLDGQRACVINLRAEHLTPSQPVWTSEKLADPYHAVVWQALTGTLAVDCLEVEE